MQGLHWCNEAKEYLGIAGAERVALTPMKGVYG